MKLLKRILLVSLFLHALVYIRAQDYLPIRDSTSAFFAGNKGKIVAVRIDSIKTEGISKVIYLNHTWNIGDYLCITPTGPSFLGAKCIIKDSKTFIFLNSDFDSVFIHYNNALNTPWFMYRYSDSSYYEAEISKKESLDFLNITDSIETILFLLKGKNGEVINNYAAFPQIIISQNYGIISSPAFNEFPRNLSIFKIIGSTKPEIGRTFLTNREIYNYNLDDEFHYETAYSNPPSGHGYFSNEIKILIRKYTSENTDTVIYTFKRTGKYENVDWSTNIHTTSYKTDTISEQYVFDKEPLYYLPDEAMTNGSHYYTSYSQSIDSLTGRLIFSPSTSSYIKIDSSCWSEPIDGGLGTSSYMEGCGILFENDDILPGQNHINLVYYRKGSESWGVPLIIDNVPLKAFTNINVYPNPLHIGELLNIEFPFEGPYFVQVFNLIGYKNQELNYIGKGIKVVNTNLLSPGIYIVKIFSMGFLVSKTKLMVL